VETERLQLRPLEEGDVDALVALDGLPEIREAVDPFGEHIPEDPAARAEYERRLVRRPGFYAAVERASGRLVGWFQFEPAGVDGAEVELGYRLHPGTWGQGLATEGARALVESALAAGETSRVYAHALTSNPGSIRVMEKIGMTYAGPWQYRGLPGVEYEARPDWEARVNALWESFDAYDEDDFVAGMQTLAAERAGSAEAAYEIGSAFDSTGHPDRAVPEYRRALDVGLGDDRRRQAVIQLASSLRNLGAPEESVALLQAERERASDELDDAVSAFLALALVDVGREREAVALALAALAEHLPRYQRSLRNYAASLGT
jgi:RimJ/RimL family protein N-acetyltransferase